MTENIKFNYFEKIDNAIIVAHDKQKNAPNNPMYPHVEILLKSIKKIVNDNVKVSEESNISNELGMLIVRRIDDEDPNMQIY